MYNTATIFLNNLLEIYPDIELLGEFQDEVQKLVLEQNSYQDLLNSIQKMHVNQIEVELVRYNTEGLETRVITVKRSSEMQKSFISFFVEMCQTDYRIPLIFDYHDIALFYFVEKIETSPQIYTSQLGNNEQEAEAQSLSDNESEIRVRTEEQKEFVRSKLQLSDAEIKLFRQKVNTSPIDFEDEVEDIWD